MNAEGTIRRFISLDSRALTLLALALSLLLVVAAHVHSRGASHSLEDARHTYEKMGGSVAAILRSRASGNRSEAGAGRPSDVASFWQQTANAAGLRQSQMSSVDPREPVPLNDYYSLKAMEIRLSGVKIRQLAEFMILAQDAWPGLVFTELTAEPSDSLLNAWNASLTASYFVKR